MHIKSNLLLLIIMASTCFSCKIKSEQAVYENYYNQLDKVLELKKKEFNHYLKLIEKSMSTIENNGPLIQSFQSYNAVFCAYKYNEPLEDTSIDLKQMDNTIQETYLKRFMIFDNIYFINLKGDVFYTLKKEPPLLDNLNETRYLKTSLSTTLKNDPSSFIVDFDIFNNDDPSAFFIYPVKNKNKIAGWCVFQLTAGKLDNIFSTGSNLGMTGEVFMVNENDYMMTSSSFSPEPSALKLHLSPENISRKFDLGTGHLEITDYRGYKALTSFEVIEFHGLRWLIIAKIDKDEVVTNLFKLSPQKYYSLIKEITRTRISHYQNNITFPKDGYSVRLDQFKRVYNNGSLYTQGVSTCTAVLVTLPGTFSYLSHISAYDKLYGGRNTDIIGVILNRIKKYEIPDYQLRDVEIYIITPQIRFSENVIEYLTTQGILLSQIHIVKNPQAQWADVYHNLDEKFSYVEWHFQNGEKKLEDLSTLLNVGELLELRNE